MIRCVGAHVRKNETVRGDAELLSASRAHDDVGRTHVDRQVGDHGLGIGRRHESVAIGHGGDARAAGPIAKPRVGIRRGDLGET